MNLRDERIKTVAPVSKYILTEPRTKVTSSILADLTCIINLIFFVLGQDRPFFIRVFGHFPEDHVHVSIIRGDTPFTIADAENT